MKKKIQIPKLKKRELIGIKNIFKSFLGYQVSSKEDLVSSNRMSASSRAHPISICITIHLCVSLIFM